MIESCTKVGFVVFLHVLGGQLWLCAPVPRADVATVGTYRNGVSILKPFASLAPHVRTILYVIHQKCSERAHADDCFDFASSFFQ